MLDVLAGWDRALFIFLNHTLANPVTDFIMPFITNDDFLRILYGVAMVLILWKGDARLRWMVLTSALVLTLTDQTASHLLKPMFERLRPCHTLDPDVINLLVGCGGGKSMPSSHAANAFGQAALFTYFFRVTRWPLWTFAAVVSISRVFVGVHYPFDVMVGAVVGIACGLLIAYVFSLIWKRWQKRRETNRRTAEAEE